MVRPTVAPLDTCYRPSPMGSAVNVDGQRAGPRKRGSPPANGAQLLRGAASLSRVVRASWPMWLVAFSLNGFFVYLAILDAIDVEPVTPLTGAYYGLVCVGLLATVWHRRGVLVARLRPVAPTVVAFVAAAAVLSLWFVLNTVLLSNGTFAARLAGLLVLWSIPTALVAATLRRTDLTEVARALAALSMVFVAIELLALVRAGTDVFRFSPIAELDPITAGLIPAIGAVAALSLRPARMPGKALQFAIVVVLVAAAVLPGSRGPVVALAFGALALALAQPLRRTAAAAVAVGGGFALGLLVASHIGSFGYLVSTDTSPLDDSTRPQKVLEAGGEEISTLSIRRQWLEDAIRDVPDEPIFGHGVGMQVDRTPEAIAMGVYGQRTYPHNTLVEAAYSLGVIGLIAYLVFIGSAVLALVSVVRRSARDEGVVFALAVGAFAFVNTNVSGEIGEDALLWTAAAVAVALYADSRRATSSSTRRV